MATKLTIWIEDYTGDEDEDPIASAISNLEYDGFNIITWDIDYDVPDPKEN